MSDVVVDSSVVGKWIFPEIDSQLADQVMNDVAAQSGRLIVLDLALVEVTNAIWKRHYRGLATLDEARQGLELLLKLPLTVHPANQLLQPALEIAAQHQRAIYDALFVALMQSLGLQGVTADEPLYNAVRFTFPHIVLLRNWR